MTSIHVKAEQPRMTNGTSVVGPNQSQSPSKYDEAERVRQHFDGLREQHRVSSEIYNRTQPIIDEQIHDETLKYLKSTQVNGTKTKSQKPRAPKRQRNAANNNNVNSNLNTNHNQSVIGNGQTTTTQQHQQVQVIRQPPAPPLPHQTQTIVQQGQQMQHIPVYPQHVQGQQQTMHVQQHNNYETFETSNGIYQQSTTPTMPAQQTHYQSQPIYNQQLQQPQHNIGPPSIQSSQHHHPQPIEQGHYIGQHQPNQQQQLYASHQSHQMHPNQGFQHIQPTQMSHPNNFPTLPNDLDLNLQAGLECDIDLLINHEMSVEGQLGFNHDLLLKLDNPHYHQHPMQHHPQRHL